MSAETIASAIADAETQKQEFCALCDDVLVLTDLLAIQVLSLPLDERRTKLTELETRLSPNGIDALKATIRHIHAERRAANAETGR